MRTRLGDDSMGLLLGHFQSSQRQTTGTSPKAKEADGDESPGCEGSDVVGWIKWLGT